MFKQFRFAAAHLVAGAMIVLTTAAASAFNQQTIAPNGNYNFDYGPLDGKTKSDDNANKSDPDSPGLHFGIQSGQTGQFGFHSFGGNSNESPPEPYARPLGNGN